MSNSNSQIVVNYDSSVSDLVDALELIRVVCIDKREYVLASKIVMSIELIRSVINNK